MSDTTQTLIRMANQIAANLAHEPAPAEATAEHIHLFWDPRMKAAIRAYEGGALSPVASEAIRLLSDA